MSKDQRWNSGEARVGHWGQYSEFCKNLRAVGAKHTPISYAAHPAVTNGLDSNYGFDGSFSTACVDRFGRIVGQKWTDDSASTTYDHYTYRYDGLNQLQESWSL